MDKVLFSSVKNNWRTPLNLFNYLNDSRDYEWDLAADEENHLCDKFYTEEDNALIQPWKGAAFLNPPYDLIAEFADKAIKELSVTEEYLSIDLLIPNRSDTRYYHKLLPYCLELITIKGRLKFINPDNNKVNSAPFPSIIMSLVPEPGSLIFSTLEPKGDSFERKYFN